MSQDDPGRSRSPRSPPPLVNGMSDQLHGEDMMGSGSGSNVQHYCLRWNNHRSNLLLVFQHLFQTESFTDVTLACEGYSIKCHKMVLAACSSYFQQLFMENSCAHPIVILKDILFYEIKAILEYMYKGEVNINQSQLPGLLRAAEALKVKGLVEDYNQNVNGEPTSAAPASSASASSSSYQPPPPPPPPPAPQSSSSGSNSEHHHLQQQQRSSTPNCSSTPKSGGSHGGSCGNSASTSSSVRFIPGETGSAVFDGHLFNGGSFHEKTSIPNHLWGTARKPSQSPSPKHGSGSSSASNFENEPAPLKRKRVYGGTRDTPILRTVLGHNGHHNMLVGIETAHSPSRYSPQHHMPSGSMNPYKNHVLPLTPNGNGTATEHGDNTKVKDESPVNFADDWNRTYESEKTYDDQLAAESEAKMSLTTTYVQPPIQKPEWKRYKQYTRADILEAINAVKEGMSALQAARKYGVPSRTLYDKVKKLGITTNRPYKKAGNGGGGTNCVTSTFGKEDSFHYSPESQHQLELNVPGPSNGRGSRGMNVVLALNGMDEDTSSRDHAGSEAECSVKQEPSPAIEDEKDDSDHMPPDSSNRSLILHEGGGGGMENGMDMSNSPPEDAPFETEDTLRSSPE